MVGGLIMAGLQRFKITSWNVKDLRGPVRKCIVNRWVADQSDQPTFLCLQEIKAEGFSLDVALNMILPNHRVIVSLPNLGSSGTTILVHPKINIVDSGGFQKGQVPW